MIKTHRPRGHLWSCPSVFQQSKEIRNVRFEDCEPPKAKVLAPDPDDELPTAQRAAKRRRIEKLANGFLNGEPLVITSARPHPSALKGTVESNERSRTGAKYTLPQPERPKDEGPIWVDVDTPAEAAEKAVRARRSGKIAKPGPIKPQLGTTFEGVETVTEETASSACKPERKIKPVKVSLEPSTEAKEQAAALRDRRLQRAVTEAPRVSDSGSSDRIEDSDGAEPRSEPGSLARPRYFRNRKPYGSEWLLRCQTTLFELSPDESVDELNRTGFDTPSRSTQASAPLNREDASPIPQFGKSSSAARLGQHATATDTVNSSAARGGLRGSIGSYEEHWDCFAPSDEQVEQSESAARGSYHTAPEVTDVGPYAATGVSQHDSQADSQIRLLRRQGITVAPRRSWASTNDTAPPPADDGHDTDDRAADSMTSLAITAIRQSLQESAQHAGKAKKGKRARSAGNTTTQAAAPSNRRRTAPTASESQKAAEEMEELPLDQRRLMDSFRAYTGVNTNDDASPFMFCKARSRPGTADGTDSGQPKQQSRATRRPVKVPSSEGAQQGHIIAFINTDAEAVPNEAPAIEMSFGNNDSFASKLHMALVDEHLNSVLPAEPGSAGRSSAVKKALRQEMRDADPKVKITRVPGEPSSSQVEGLEEARRLSFEAIQTASGVANEEEEEAEEVSEKQQAQTQWPGTQALLHQAHQDFLSPMKAVMAQEPTAVDTPQMRKSASQPTPSTTARPPLRELSQEQLPATQALMAGWSPWSTIKKPKGVTTRVTALSPTVGERRLQTRTGRDSLSLSDPGAAHDAGQRRNSLRFSTNMTSGPPRQSSLLSFSITKPASQERHDTSASGHISTPKSILRSKRQSQGELLSDPTHMTWDPTNIEPSMAAIETASTEASTDPAVSSFQCAQPRMFRDDSQLDQTIDDLTASVLFLNDMDGVLSQSRS